MTNIIIIAIFILPWLIIPNNSFPDPTRIIKSSVFDFAMMAVIACSLINGFKFEYRNKFLAWVAIVVFFGFAFNWYYPLMVGYGYNSGTIEPNLHFLFSLIATICVCSTFERNDFVRVSKAVVFSTTLVAIFAFLQLVGLDPMKHVAKYTAKETRHLCALLDHPDILGNYLALSIPFFLYLLRPIYFIPLAIVVIVLFFVHSSISIIAAIISLIVFYLLRYRNSKKWKIGLLGITFGLMMICLMPSFNKSGNGFTGRTEAWKIMVERMDNPIFGRGLGIVKSLGVQTGHLKEDGINRENFWVFAHNDYLEIYCAGGLILLFLFLLLVGNAFKKFNYKEDNVLGFSFLASFVAFLILMMGSFPMEIAPLALGGLISFWGVSKV